MKRRENTMINLTRAYQTFHEYLAGYDKENERIKLKIIHTDGVIRCAREIAERMGLSEEDKALAELIALLHDIGRFEQVIRYNSFEPFTMDHANFGVELLFGKKSMEDPMIRRFVKEDTWDDIIKTAIGQHSLYAIEEIKDERTLLHAKLIRDADKLDNCRVKLEESLNVLLGMEAEQVGLQEISDVIWQTCLQQKSVISADRVTKMDYWVSYIAYFFDINFAESFTVIHENNYVSRIIARIPYGNEVTKAKMAELQELIETFVERKMI